MQMNRIGEISLKSKRIEVKDMTRQMKHGHNSGQNMSTYLTDILELS